MFPPAGVTIQIVDRTLQQKLKLLFFLFRKILHHFFLGAADGLVHGFMQLRSLFLHIDPLAAAILGIGTHFNKALLLQTDRIPETVG